MITAVDIDAAMLTVATNYFGLTCDDKLKVVIDDGLAFLEKAANAGKYSANCRKASQIVTLLLFGIRITPTATLYVNMCVRSFQPHRCLSVSPSVHSLSIPPHPKKPNQSKVAA